MPSPSQASARIREYIRVGMPVDVILERMEPLGPPKKWILDKIDTFNRELLRRPPAIDRKRRRKAGAPKAKRKRRKTS
jgi:hypothetical protein